MELRFDAMLYSNLGNENFDAGHSKCSRGPHFARGWLIATLFLWSHELVVHRRNLLYHRSSLSM